MTLVARNDELATLASLLDRCLRGEGGIAVISGAAACGKTEVLNAFCERVAGATLLRASASCAERGLPLGVSDQLFSGATLSPACAERVRTLMDDCVETTAHAESEQEVIGARHVRTVHELCSIMLGLAASSPVVITVDDVHHADGLSLQLLLHLSRRTRSAPVLILLTVRTGPEASLPTFGAELIGLPHCQRLRLAPLSESGVDALLAGRLGAENRHSAEWYAVTGGNPRLVHAMVEDHLAGCKETPARCGCSPITGTAFREAVVTCVHRCGPITLQGARGLAVLDRADAPALLAELTGVEASLTDQIVGALVAAGLVGKGRFRSEAARSAVLEDVPTGERAALHQRAAELLRREGAPPMAVAAHLVAADERCAPWGVPVLIEAAKRALAENLTELAVTQFRLAERSCEDEHLRPLIIAPLAHAEWRINPAAVAPQLPRLIAAFRDDHLSGSEVIAPISFLLWHGRFEEAEAALERLTATTDRSLAPHLRTFHLWIASTYPTLKRHFPQELVLDDEEKDFDPGSFTLDFRVGATSALARVLRQGPSANVVAGAEHVLQHCRLGHTSIEPVRLALYTLIYADRLDKAAPWCDTVQAELPARRAPSWQAMLAAIRGEIALRQGDPAGAKAQARTALTLMSKHSWGVEIGAPLAVLVQATTAMGRYDEAAEALSVPVPQTMYETRWGLGYLQARGHYQLANEHLHAALSDFLTCGKLMEAWDMDLPALVPWRSDAAYVYLRLGQEQEARRLAEEQLDRPGARHSRTHGISLRAHAASSELRHRPHLLRKAAEELLECGDKLEFARTLADLGDAHRGRGESERARMMARRAWHVTNECEYEALRTRLSLRWLDDVPEAVTEPELRDEGLTDLSQAEHRVAALAAMGHTNREIAHKLYITISTVEQHLTRAYRKLDVRKRTDLPVRLQLRNAPST
jgi:DNA-binding CsgD family transcriptional regulator/predicted negative regulator of RcsB-dependent stress response